MRDVPLTSTGSTEALLPARPSIGTMLRAPAFWEQRPLRSVARLLLLLAVGVLVCIAIGFILASSSFTRNDLLAIAFCLGLAAFAWHPATAAVIVMLISGVGVVFTDNGGDLLELSIALGLVAATCVRWVIVTHVALLATLTAHLSVSGSTLAAGGVFAIAGVAVISFLVGVGFRLVAAREMLLIAERTRIANNLEAITREERERIADELHDGIAHDLTLVLFHARALPRQPDDKARQLSLTTIEDSAEQALKSIQALLSLMRDTPTESTPRRTRRYDGNVADAVASMAALLRDAGISTRVAAPHVPLSVGPGLEQVLIDIAHEAVTNIIKHAPNSHSATVEVSNYSDHVELVVTNSAVANVTGEGRAVGHRGLARAKQRLGQSGGDLHYGWTAGGWTLRATLPVTIGPAQ